VISGHPAYEVTDGDILFNGESVLDMEPDERARPASSWPSSTRSRCPGVHRQLHAHRAGREAGEEVDVFEFATSSR
jgi:Fe-S cluster assembly ATP-binding protein